MFGSCQYEIIEKFYLSFTTRFDDFLNNTIVLNEQSDFNENVNNLFEDSKNNANDLWTASVEIGKKYWPNLTLQQHGIDNIKNNSELKESHKQSIIRDIECAAFIAVLEHYNELNVETSCYGFDT